MEEVESGSVAAVITSPPQPHSKSDFELIRNRLASKDSLERYLGLKNFFFEVFSQLQAIISEVHRVLKEDGVFIFNIGMPTRGSELGKLFHNLEVYPDFYPLWWCEYLQIASKLHLCLSISVAKVGSLPIHKRQSATRIIPNGETFLAYAKKYAGYKFRPDKAVQGVCFTHWPIVTNRTEIAEELESKYDIKSPGATFEEYPIEQLIQLFTDEGDTVLDPLAGTGTLGMVANRLGRNSVLYEQNENLKPVILDRVKSSGGQIIAD